MLDALGGVRFDDYLAEPWSPEELRFRVRRLLPIALLRIGDATISWAPHWIRASRAGGDDRSMTLPPDQYAIFEVLARAGGQVVEREVLLTVSAPLPDGSRALDMRVARLRGRLRDLTRDWPEPPVVRALRGVGYRLDWPGAARQRV